MRIIDFIERALSFGPHGLCALPRRHRTHGHGHWLSLGGARSFGRRGAAAAQSSLAELRARAGVALCPGNRRTGRIHPQLVAARGGRTGAAAGYRGFARALSRRSHRACRGRCARRRNPGSHPGNFAPILELIGGGPFALPAGAWSDDTAMALCLAESLLERGGFDARDQMQRYGAGSNTDIYPPPGARWGSRRARRARWRWQNGSANSSPVHTIRASLIRNPCRAWPQPSCSFTPRHRWRFTRPAKLRAPPARRPSSSSAAGFSPRFSAARSPADRNPTFSTPVPTFLTSRACGRGSRRWPPKRASRARRAWGRVSTVLCRPRSGFPHHGQLPRWRIARREPGRQLGRHHGRVRRARRRTLRRRRHSSGLACESCAS